MLAGMLVMARPITSATPSGLPVGVMLAARPAEEPLLLSLSAQIEDAALWDHRLPPGW